MFTKNVISWICPERVGELGGPGGKIAVTRKPRKKIASRSVPSGNRTRTYTSESERLHQTADACAEPCCRHHPSIWANSVTTDEGGGQWPLGSEHMDQDQRDPEIREAGNGHGRNEYGCGARRLPNTQCCHRHRPRRLSPRSLGPILPHVKCNIATFLAFPARGEPPRSSKF
jgi:hypothetical protein